MKFKNITVVNRPFISTFENFLSFGFAAVQEVSVPRIARRKFFGISTPKEVGFAFIISLVQQVSLGKEGVTLAETFNKINKHKKHL